MKRRGPRIVLLLLGVNAFLLLLPLGALGLWKVYDQYLLRQTERQLIAQSVVIAEAYRVAYFEQTQTVPGDPRPPGSGDSRYVAVEPLIDLGTRIGPHREVESLPEAPRGESTARRAGASIEAILRGSQIFNLSGMRVLDPQGCVVATTGGQRGRCLSPLAEVQRALSGHYASKARYRMPSNPLPPLGDIQRRGKLRVFTALPIFSDGKVIGVVAASRTGLDALSSAWRLRRPLVSTVLIVLLLMVSISVLFARAIARPMHRITRKAEAIARGEPAEAFVAQGFTPAEIRTLSQALDVMTQKLQDRARYVADFATTVSHELKTPIAAIRGAVELLQDWEQMEPTQRARFLDNVDQDAQRMERLVTRLLALAKIESGEELATPRTAVGPCARQALQRFGNALTLELDDPELQLDIAEEHLSTIFSNLADNAIRHHDASQGPVRVSVNEHGRQVVISVADRGPGIKPANQPKIGTRFFTTERDQGGTGLGLSIVKAIALKRGGGLQFDTSPHGTTFRVTL